MSDDTSIFKKYYSNPEWREKHLAKLKAKVKCQCGTECSKVNLTRHMQTKAHEKNMNAPYECVCGMTVKRKDKYKHERSKEHILNLTFNNIDHE